MRTKPARKEYALLAIVGTIAACVIEVLDTGSSIGAAKFGSLLGGLLVLVGVPYLIARWLSVSGAWVALVLLSLGASQGKLNWIGVDRTALAVDALTQQGPIQSSELVPYTAPRCEFSVLFPVKPVLKTYTKPVTGDYEEALVAQNESMMRTECTPFATQEGDSESRINLLKNFLTNYVVHNGLTHPEYSYSELPLGTTAELTASKTIGGKLITYKLRAVMGDKSLIALYVGGEAESFPQPGLMNFLASVQRN